MVMPYVLPQKRAKRKHFQDRIRRFVPVLLTINGAQFTNERGAGTQSVACETECMCGGIQNMYQFMRGSTTFG